METKRLLLAIGISALIPIVWQALFPPPKPVAPQAGQAVQAQAPAEPGAAAAPATMAAPQSSAVVQPPPAQVVAIEKAQLKNELISVALTNRGGMVEGITLAGYNDAPGPEVFVAVFGRTVPEATATVIGQAQGGPRALVDWAERTAWADAVVVERVAP